MTRRNKGEDCLNCGYHFSGLVHFCPHCGQENYRSVLPLGEILSEFGEHVLHWDSKLVHTLKYLIINPGFLTVENLEGRRIRYVLPFRLYLLMSFLFFLLVSYPSRKSEDDPKPQGSNISIQFKSVNSRELRGVKPEDLPKFMLDHQVADTTFNRYFLHQMQRMANASASEYIHMLVKTLSYTMFLVIPLVGFWTYLFNRKQRPFYMESFIFSLHFQAFMFLLLAGIWVLILYTHQLYFFISTLCVFLAWSIVYLFLALSRFSGSGWLVTGLKCLVIWMLYWVTQSSFIIVAALISLIIF
jgi:hypothetical protein